MRATGGPTPRRPGKNRKRCFASCSGGLRANRSWKLAHDSERSSQLALAAADRENRPVLAAQATGGLQDGDLPAMYANKGYVAAGLSVSVPLFTGRRITGERISARADLRSAQDRVSELDRTITADIEDAFSDFKAARAKLASADLLVAQAQEALGLAKSRYSNGVITNFELLDAQSNARAAEQTRLQARYDCVLASQAIARAAGRPPRAAP
jgi:outer membrane protein TolC